MDDLRRKLRKAVARAGGPQVIAREIGVSRKTVWTWETGRAVPNSLLVRQKLRTVVARYVTDVTPPKRQPFG